LQPADRCRHPAGQPVDGGGQQREEDPEVEDRLRPGAQPAGAAGPPAGPQRPGDQQQEAGGHHAHRGHEQGPVVVERARTGDRRKVLVRLTEQGVALVDDVLVGHVAAEREILAALSPRQQHDLARLLRTTLLALGDRAEGQDRRP
jgi:hypothetical protein